MIPRFIRNRKARTSSSQAESKEWNPATFYIIMFTLIGSQAIRMLTLKNDFTAYTRSTDAKIELLKEVIERVKKGEKVDVEKLLGTGDEAREKEWEEGITMMLRYLVLWMFADFDTVLREIEEEDSLWYRKEKKEAVQQPEEPQPVQKFQVKEEESTSAEEIKSQSPRKTRFF